MRDFEEQIISSFKTFDPQVGGGRSKPRKGLWVRGHLSDVREDFIHGMFERWCLFTKAAALLEAMIESGDYGSFRTYIYLLKKHGLVIPTRRERAKTTSREFFRQYYRVNPGLLRDPRWLNPYREYPSWKKWQRKGFPRPKKKPRPRLPPGVPPFPWISTEETSRIWSEAERFLREHDYTINRAELEQILPGWSIEAAGYKTFKERVGYVIHEAVEIEEVAEVARRFIDPRLAPEPVALKAHKVAEKLEKEYLRKA